MKESKGKPIKKIKKREQKDKEREQKEKDRELEKLKI